MDWLKVAFPVIGVFFMQIDLSYGQDINNTAFSPQASDHSDNNGATATSNSMDRRRLAIAIVAGSAGLLLVLSFAVWITSRILRSKFRRKMASISRRDFDISIGYSLSHDPTAKFSLRELSHATNHFSAERVIGKGTSAVVYKAVLSDGRSVVVKRYHVPREGNSNLEYQILSVAQHKQIVQLLGYSSEDPVMRRLLVFELMENGSLSYHLHDEDTANNGSILQWETRLRIAMDISRALCFLHVYSEPCIVHGNITSDNILLGSGWNAKLGGFGRAVYSVSSDGVTYTTPMVPAKSAPGYADPDGGAAAGTSDRTPAVKSSDVYSFGVVLLELLSGRRARDLRYQPSDLASWAAPPAVQAGYAFDALIDTRLAVPQKAALALRKAMEMAFWCMKPRKRDRPTMVDVVTGLEQVYKMCYDEEDAKQEEGRGGGGGQQVGMEIV